jgi:DNA-directed RNA polymerase specialized sigma24 family protein
MEKPKITKSELKAIMADYMPNEAKDDDDTLLLKEALQSLNTSDRIIFTLYIDFASEQKLATLLGVSRTPVHNLIVKCRKEINEYVKNKKK